jgi:hypothetical protein
VVEIDEGVFGPERAPKFVACNEFSTLFEQRNEQQEGLALELDPDAPSSDFARTKIDLEDSEPE